MNYICNKLGTLGICCCLSKVPWYGMAFLGCSHQQLTTLQGGIRENAREGPLKLQIGLSVSREQINEKCEKMYILTRMAYYAEELWILLQKDNIVIYVCGLKGMEQGIDEIMSSPAERDGIVCADYKKQLKKAEQWNVEVY